MRFGHHAGNPSRLQRECSYKLVQFASGAVMRIDEVPAKLADTVVHTPHVPSLTVHPIIL